MTPGELKRIRRFYQRERQALFSYTLSWTGDRAAAEDIIQQTFLKILGNGGLPRHIRPYVFRALRNGAVDLARSRERRPESLFDLDQLPADPPARELDESLCRALDELGEQEREVIILKELDGLTLREIAEVMDAPIGSVASRHRRGLEKLRTLLKKE